VEHDEILLGGDTAVIAFFRLEKRDVARKEDERGVDEITGPITTSRRRKPFLLLL
jgi:hypothetical protein